MRLFTITPTKDKKGTLALFKVDVRNNGKLEKSLILKIGQKYRVEPYNKLKLKHRGRSGILMGYSTDDWGRIYGRLKFDDTHRIGKVDVEELVEI
ncbi:hypothetical protein M2277_005684 [Paenibacillus sp. LBL]|uniref:hypothetical protein n=1 Tax=Paenibacillus sp. LBL TaxID=2940563 RepID=UPI0024754157|nr:hypothetical protein [Paenibacillus sp. LBL]MDH6674985.1 hypothetical protein [Paenibacillus sp. LBL]